MDLIYKKAMMEDIDILTETRIQVLRAANQLSDDIDMSEVKKHSYVLQVPAVSAFFK